MYIVKRTENKFFDRHICFLHVYYSAPSVQKSQLEKRKYLWYSASMTKERLETYRKNYQHLIDNGYMTADGKAAEEYKPIYFVDEVAFVGKGCKRIELGR